MATGGRLGDVIPGVNFPTAGGSVEWDAGGTGFYYTRYPQGDERPPEDRHFFQQVYFHRLGTPVASDHYVIGKQFPRIAEIYLTGSRDGRALLAVVRNGDGGEIGYHLRTADGRWHEVAGFKDGVKHLTFGDDGMLYGLSVKDAPLGRIIAIPVSHPSLAFAKVVVPELKLVAEDVQPTRSRLYVTYRDGGPRSCAYTRWRAGSHAKSPPRPWPMSKSMARLDGDACWSAA